MAIIEAASAAIGRLLDQWLFVLSMVLVFAAAWFIQSSFRQDPLSKIPFVGLEIGDESERQAAFLQNAKEIYSQGYEQFKQSLFRITSTRGKLALGSNVRLQEQLLILNHSQNLQ